MRSARRKPMLVTFLRAGERRYAVRVAVEGGPILEMCPAPGYDPLMPHDLQHFIVERAFGMEGAIRPTCSGYNRGPGFDPQGIPGNRHARGCRALYTSRSSEREEKA